MNEKRKAELLEEVNEVTITVISNKKIFLKKKSPMVIV